MLRKCTWCRRVYRPHGVLGVQKAVVPPGDTLLGLGGETWWVLVLIVAHDI